MLERLWNVFKGIIMGLVIWFGSQALVGLIVGTVGNVNSWDTDFTLGLAVILGVITSIISEVIYIISIVRDGD